MPGSGLGVLTGAFFFSAMGRSLTVKYRSPDLTASDPSKVLEDRREPDNRSGIRPMD
jgi:hypothetical protein